VDVASTRPVKQTKKTMFLIIATAVVAGMVAGASGSKVVSGTKKL
jgi:hypothetical protein